MPTVQARDARRALARARPRKRYKPDIVRAAFADRAVGEESDGEQRMYCPVCEDPGTSHSPSAMLNAEKGVWSCKKSDHSDELRTGQVYDLVKHLEATTAFRIRGTATQDRTSRAESSGGPKPLENQDGPHEDAALLHSGRPRSGKHLDYLMRRRGLTLDTIHAFHIGHNGQRFTIPVRLGVGPWVNVRRYLPDADGQQKMLNTPGHGSPAVFAFTETLRGNTLPVIICEGEWDALLTGQQLAGHAVAITGTGGAGRPPKDLSALAGREVFILYDNDAAGMEGAAKLEPRIRKVGGAVYVLDPNNLGLPYTDNHGADATDYWMKYGGTVEAFMAEVDRARREGESDRDEIDEAMEAAFLELGTPRRDYADALLSEDDILGRPPVQYIVEPFIPRGMFTDAFGQPGSYKTYIAQDMFNAVRAGIPWHGHAVTRGAVLLLEAEGVEQLQTRIVAWAEHHGAPDMRELRVLEEPVNLGSPEGAAALVRTVQRMQETTGDRVELIVVDPAALYMGGGENEDGNLDLARGLNAVAKFLACGVLLIAHTNASGERARGTDHLRMLSGSHIRVERTDAGHVAVVQEKVKNATERAVVLRPVTVGAGLAFDTVERTTAAEYAAAKTSAARATRANERIVLSEEKRRVVRSKADALILQAVTATPGIVKGRLMAACKGHGAGVDALEVALDALIESGTIRTETTGTAVNSPRRHYLAEPSDP